jgi:hypothetical protein
MTIVEDNERMENTLRLIGEVCRDCAKLLEPPCGLTLSFYNTLHSIASMADAGLGVTPLPHTEYVRPPKN